MRVNFKINSDGDLLIERKGGMKDQFCPKSMFPLDKMEGSRRSECGDWCPMFGELRSIPVAGNANISVLLICENVELRGECTDERS